MSVGPLGGLIGSAAGAPLSQTSGSETDRASRDSAAHERLSSALEKAERAAGIGTTEQDQETSERDADGRRIWEDPPNSKKSNADCSHEIRQSRDTTGQSGTQLDLTG
jgi:hypothetical protein